MPPSPDRWRFTAAFAATYLVWGSTYLAVALALQGIPPLLLMGGRSVLAGAVLLGLSRLQSGRWLPARDVPLAAGTGILLFLGCHGTIAYAQQHVPSGLTAILIATTPFWISLLNRLAGQDRRGGGAASLGAMLPGLAGVGLIAWRGGAEIAPGMVLLLLVSALLWAAGSVLSRRHDAETPALALSGLQLLSGGLALLVVSAAFGETGRFQPGAVPGLSWAAAAYLTLAGSIIAFSAYIWLLDHAPAPLVATYTFVNPVIAVLLGWAILGERPGLPTLIGMALVVGSVAGAWWLESRATRGGAHG